MNEFIQKLLVAINVQKYTLQQLSFTLEEGKVIIRVMPSIIGMSADDLEKQTYRLHSYLQSTFEYKDDNGDFRLEIVVPVDAR